MCHIMDALHQYVPAISTDKSLLLPNGDSFNYKKVDMWETLFGGDQLTASRIRGSISIRANHPNALERFEGLIPTVEDWHTRMTFMKV